MIFQIAVFIAAAIAGGIATVTGFGIGSVLTPPLATSVGTRLAVADAPLPSLLWNVPPMLDDAAQKGLAGDVDRVVHFDHDQILLLKALGSLRQRGCSELGAD